MTFEDKLEATRDFTGSFINVISSLNDDPVKETPFFAPLVAFMELAEYLMEIGWTREELADMLGMPASGSVTN